MTDSIRGLANGLVGLALAVGCGGTEGVEETPPAITSYRTTSNVGDLSTWTFSGNELTVVWQDIAKVTGALERTYDVTAICGSVNPDFGYRSCLVDAASCTPGTAACMPGDGPQQGETFRAFEIPGVALAVSANDEELHAGFAAQDCENVITDDYTFVNIGLGQHDAIGLFRTDSEFSAVHHMDFGFSDDPDNRISYNTGDPAGKTSGITASACSGGVRELTIDQTGDKLRVIVTASGHLIIDKPEGEGGMLAISAANAATIDDFANKTWGGISFPDDRPPEYVRVTTGASANGRVQVMSIHTSGLGDITPASPVYLNSGAAGAKLNETMVEAGAAYATNQIVIDGSYTGGPSELPGIIELDPVSGDETAILGIGATVNGKTTLFGAVVNGYEGATNAVKGNFILFER